MDEKFYEDLFNIIHKSLLDKNYLKIINNKSKEDQNIKKMIDKKNKQIEKVYFALDRIEDAFEEGAYDLQEMSRRTKKRKKEIELLNKEVNELKIKINSKNKLTEDDIEERINLFKKLWSQIGSVENLLNIPPKDLNNFLKKVVAKITYNRTDIDNKVKFEIELI